MPIRSDLSRQQVMTQRRIGATVTYLCITICHTAIKLFAMRSDLSRQRCTKQPAAHEARSTCLCNTIRFILLAVSFLQYNLIHPDSNILLIGALKRLAPAMCYNTICHTGYHVYAIRSDLSRQRITIRFVLLLKTIYHYDMICPGA